MDESVARIVANRLAGVGRENVDTPIENHGVVGDLATVALITLDGTIDFLCWGEFDAPTIFASLLGGHDAGFFAITPELEKAKKKQLYLPDTNVLVTRFLSEAAVVEITDFMPVDDGPQRLVRVVRVVRGEATFHVRCAPRFDYARSTHAVEEAANGAIAFLPATGAAIRLVATTGLAVEGMDAMATFTLKKGEEHTFVLEDHADDAPCNLEGYGQRTFDGTVAYWRHWMGKSTYRGRWREIVNRSALILKLLTSRKSGAIVAAPTFGLPESPGVERNWDYRYTWIRDAGFTVYSLMRLGYTEEAEAFMEWVADRVETDCKKQVPLQVMYGIDGRKELVEKTLDNLSGYQGAQPVRIGNAAYEQLQLDIYGALMDAIYLSNKYGQPASYERWRDMSRVVDWVTENWNQPDEGIWEFRGGRRDFLHSRLMCWVAVDRAIRLAIKRSLPASIAKWHAVRDEIHADIHANFWDEKQRAFVQSKGSTALDAACLLMPLLRFISPVDPRWLSTLDAIGKTLTEDALVRRYDIEASASVDALKGQEGRFVACSFWYVECLARAGRLDEARLLFEKIFGFANHLGLFAEELGIAGEHLGNFPQALTHLALISAAYTLDRELTGAPRAGWQR